MKVAVVGMLPRQEQELGVHNFKHLDVRFANKGPKYGLNETVFDSVDRIVVMAKWISHALIGKLDRSKTTMIQGGLGKARAELQRLNDLARMHETPAPRVAHPLSYSTVEDSNVADNNPYNALILGAKEGDVLTFTRPPHTTIDKWKTQWQVRRSYYKLNYGVHSEIEYRDGKAALLITKVAPQEGRRSGKKVVTEAEAGEVLGLPAPPAQTLSDQLKQPPEEAEIEHDFSNARRGAVIQIPNLFERDQYTFWTEVFMQSMRNNPGATPLQHKDHANAALAAFRANFVH